MSPFRPALEFLVAYLGVRHDRARNAESRGASAVEWVVIAAIVVGIALAIGLVLRSALTSRAEGISSEIEGS